MRPVDKGVSPRAYGRYQDSQRDLIERLGDYCSYCERQIETNLAVEHVQPKSVVPALRNEWINFLLGCVNCNSCKGDVHVEIEECLWPDRDNTIRGFQYSRGGLIRPNAALPKDIQDRANALIELVGLDREPGTPGKEPTTSDQRWLRRQEAWQMAEHYRGKLAANDIPLVRELIVDLVKARGEFTVWWTVFDGDVDMRRRLREAFIGTDATCFDANEDAVARAGGFI